jgi:hypothetical protein
MEFDTLEALPARVDVAQIVSSRYPAPAASQPKRPLSWDERMEGVDVILTTDGRRLKLLSDGQQSPPLPGWGIVINGGDASSGYRWTLYALGKGAVLAESVRI